jgi:hypothetical protein
MSAIKDKAYEVTKQILMTDKDAKTLSWQECVVHFEECGQIIANEPGGRPVTSSNCHGNKAIQQDGKSKKFGKPPGKSKLKTVKEKVAMILCLLRGKPGSNCLLQFKLPSKLVAKPIMMGFSVPTQPPSLNNTIIGKGLLLLLLHLLL